MTAQSELMLPGFDSRRRAFIIASFLALTSALAAVGLFPWQPPAILLVWLLLIKATELLLSRQNSPQIILRIATVAFCADTLFVTGCVFYAGGAMWIGAAFYLFLVMVSASMLPLRNALWVAGSAVATFALLTLAEVSGQITRPPLFGIPGYAGDYRLGIATVVVAATTMGLALLVQHALVSQIRRSEQSQRLIFEAASDVIATLSDSGRILRVNAAAFEQMGYGRDDLVGTDIKSLVLPGDLPAFEQTLDLARLGSRVSFDVSYSHKSGGHRWLAGTVTPIPAEASEAAMLLIARDTTRARIAERDRERLRNELAQALRIQALGRLVSGVAHELNNPLTTILTTADDMLDGGVLEPDDRESLSIVRQQAHRARATVRKLVAFVRSGSERKHERILPSAALAEVLAVVRPEVELSGARLETHIAPDMEPIEIDRAGFDQVVSNMVSNAAQAAGAGGLVVVRACPADRTCEIVVEDNGPGISSEALAHMFEPFFTTKSVGHGMGLGLSLALGIVQHYHGSIAADNMSYATEGSSGARFTVRFPNAPPGHTGPITEVAGAQRPSAVEPPAEPDKLPPDRRTVLVIDDEEPIRRALRRYLERFGWAVEDFASAVEALPVVVAPAASERYAAIICDIKMPGMTGLELCSRLVTDAPHMVPRLILTSGDLSLSDQELRECVAGGMLAKPYDVDELRALVDRIAHTPAPG